MATSYYQDPFGAPGYSAEGMPSLFSLSNLESLGRGSVAGLLDLPSIMEKMLMGDVDPRMPSRQTFVPSSEQALATTPRMTQPTPQAGLLETAGAFMSPAPMAAVKPVAQAVGRGGKAVARMAGEEINAAMMGERGGLLGAMTPQPKQIFIGENAKTWNKAGAEKFLQLEKSGADPVTAWQQTGTFRSPDGKLRQEINDQQVQFIEKGYKNLRRRKDYSDVEPNLSTILMHEELINAYPELKQTNVGKLPYGSGGSASPYSSEKISLGNESKEEMRSSALHELQHLVQNIEGFAPGGYINKIKPPVMTDEIASKIAILKNTFENLPPGSRERIFAIDEYRKLADIYDPYNIYTRIAGEAESRAVQKRKNMIPEERLQKFPLESYDVPVESLLFP